MHRRGTPAQQDEGHHAGRGERDSSDSVPRCATLWLQMSSGTLAERTILITGGTGGVGLEAARRLHSEGAQVIIGSRDPAHYADVATSLGGDRVHPFVADLANGPEVAAQV